MTGLPDDVVDDAERLTRLARAASDPAEAEAYRARRRETLADHGYAARVREADDVLVLHPEEWVEDGTVLTEHVADVDRAVEVPLSGPGPAEDWAAVAEHNDLVAAAVRSAHGDVHGDTARAFADFMSNHHARRVETATDDEVAEFREEYFPRNAWPTDDQRAALEESLALVLEAAEGVDGEDGGGPSADGDADGSSADGDTDGSAADGDADGSSASGDADGLSADGDADGSSASGDDDGSSDGS